VGEFILGGYEEAEGGPPSPEAQDEASHLYTLSETMALRAQNALGEKWAQNSAKVAEVRQELEQQYGNRLFAYEHITGIVYTGTMAQIVEDCPHARSTALNDGVEGVVALLAPHEKLEDEEKKPEDDTETATEEGVAPTEPKTQHIEKAFIPDIPAKHVAEKAAKSDAASPVVENAPAAVVTAVNVAEAKAISASKEIAGDTTEIIAPIIVESDAFLNEKSPTPEQPVESGAELQPEALPLSEGIVEQPIEADLVVQTKEQSIEVARAEALSLYEDEPVVKETPIVSSFNETVIERAIERAAERDDEPVEQTEPQDVVAQEYIEVLQDDPEVVPYVELFFDEIDEPIETYESVFEIVQAEQAVPAELVFAQLIDVPVAAIFSETVQKERDEGEMKLQPDRAFTQETFTQALIRLRVELAYVELDADMTFDQLPDSLKVQLLDLLYRLGYDDALGAMQELLKRHGLDYLLYFISQVGVNGERTARQHTIAAARKKKHSLSLYTDMHAKIAQFVIGTIKALPSYAS